MNTGEIEVLAIVGVGLIGGSIGLAAQHRGVAQRIVGIGRREGSLQAARDRGAVTEITTEIAAGVRDADLVVVCSPVETIPTIVAEVARFCPPHAILTDAGSTKQLLVERIAQASSNTANESHRPTFIGSHPLAGSEKTGVAHSREDLLDNRVVVLTPTADVAAGDVARLRAFWERLGARVFEMTPADHDAALAATSHLPHAVAAILAAVTPAEYLHLAATGWADTTRIAAGDVELWLQIFRENRLSVLRSLDQFAKVLTSFTQAMERQDDARIAEILALGKQRRDALAD